MKNKTDTSFIKKDTYKGTNRLKSILHHQFIVDLNLDIEMIQLMGVMYSLSLYYDSRFVFSWVVRKDTILFIS